MNQCQRIAAIRSKVTPEFLATLQELIKIYGWTGDLCEVAYFGDWVFEDVAGHPSVYPLSDRFEAYD